RSPGGRIVACRTNPPRELRDNAISFFSSSFGSCWRVRTQSVTRPGSGGWTGAGTFRQRDGGTLLRRSPFAAPYELCWLVRPVVPLQFFRRSHSAGQAL